MPNIRNQALNDAAVARRDEFYTQMTDIEREVYYYWPSFRGKTVLCNCDDPRVSNFFKYFTGRFEQLGLKRVIATCFKNQNPDIFSMNKCERAVYQIYDGDKNGNRRVDAEEIEVKPLKGDGSFDSDECKKLLQEADIVVTNPPFSLFREFVNLLFEYDKKFLIIGNQNAITYKDVFPLIKENKMWLGCSIHSGDRKFNVPDSYPLNAAGCGIDEDGRKFIRVKGVRWFTNLDYRERHEELPLVKKYNPVDYPKYDNYDAINVNRTSDIPCDYYGVMGVPITFMDKFCPEQFEIVGIDRYVKDNPRYGHRFTINGKETYARLLIRRKQ
ncbi:MAG: adenine-specific methyltransferase EcoRI family protein [Alloprevotella sp.]|nr:adenine-specific methyltransferase EcoRI family protein [Alloprevotella sp.]